MILRGRGRRDPRGRGNESRRWEGLDIHTPPAADSLAMLLKLDGHEVHTVYGATEAIPAARFPARRRFRKPLSAFREFG